MAFRLGSHWDWHSPTVLERSSVWKLGCSWVASLVDRSRLATTWARHNKLKLLRYRCLQLAMILLSLPSGRSQPSTCHRSRSKHLEFRRQKSASGRRMSLINQGVRLHGSHESSELVAQACRQTNQRLPRDRRRSWPMELRSHLNLVLR